MTTVPTTNEPLTANINKADLTVFAPRNAQEAEYRGVFFKEDGGPRGEGLTYAHFNGKYSTTEDGSDVQPGLVVAYSELADKLGELLLSDYQAFKANKKNKDKEHEGLKLIADMEMRVEPIYNGEGQHQGNNVSYRVYGFQHDGFYYSTKLGKLTITALVAPTPARQKKVSFF